MASVVTSYSYTVQMTLVIDSKDYPIDSRSINTIITNYDYDQYNMPVIYLGLRLNSDIYNKMVNNTDRATISFRVFKYNTEAPNTVKTIYFEDRFLYFISSDPNYMESMQNMTSSSAIGIDTQSDTYLEGYIGLMSLKCINDNKVLINDIVKDSNPLSVVYKYTKHMKMCIEPFDNNDVIDQFIIPPITTITAFLRYLNNYYCFYKTGYRFFRDFSVTYLLSTRGNPVKEISNKFSSIILVIRDPVDSLNKINSVEIDNANNAYIIYINADDTSLKVNRENNKSFNSIIGIDTLGNNTEEVLNLPDVPDSTEKYIVERVASNNFDKIYNTKQNIESSSVVLTVNKTEVDGSIFTPNKEYYVRNYSSSSKYDGKFILSYKKEIMIRDDTSFTSSIALGLRKVYE